MKKICSMLLTLLVLASTTQAVDHGHTVQLGYYKKSERVVLAHNTYTTALEIR